VASADEIAIFDDGKIAGKIKSNAAFVSLSLDGKLLATASAGGEIQVWKTEDDTLQKHLPGVAGVSALRFSPKNQALALGSKDGRVSLWDLQSGAMIFDAKKHSAMVNAIGFSADGKLMATGSDDRSAIIWEVASGKARRTLKGHDFTVTSLAFSPGDDLLAVGSGNASVVLWDVATGKLNRVMR
jgi:WD40 repeat protein